jgi:hypothetical protein
MTVKIFKSTWTWRSLAHQDRVLEKVVPDYKSVSEYVDDEGLESLFRPTTRKAPATIYICSMGILGAEDERVEIIAREFMKREWRLIAVEENIDWKKLTVREVLDSWSHARINGAAMVGSRISSANRRAKVQDACRKIKERWRLPSKIWPTTILLEEADISLNSVKSVLGSRLIAQKNYQTMLRRKEREAKGVRYKRAGGYIDEVPDDHYER